MSDKVSLEEKIAYVDNHRTAKHMQCLDDGEQCLFCTNHGDLFDAIRAALIRGEELEKKVGGWQKRIVEDIGLEKGDAVMDEGGVTLDFIKTLLDEIRDFLHTKICTEHT